MIAAPPKIVVAATGLLFEAHIAEQAANVTAVAGGGNAAILERRLLESAQKGARAIMSFGLAGALDPALKAGDTCIGSTVETVQGRLATDPQWLAAICAKLPDAKPVPVLGTDTAVTSAAAKRDHFARSGCRIVDMESHVAGRVAEKLGLPFAVLRVISDSARSDLPPAAVAGMRPDGRTDLPAVLGSLARNPRQLPALIQLAVATGKARQGLLRCVRLLGPGLGGIDLS